MAREKSDALAFERADNDGIGGIAEGSLDANFARVGEAVHVIQAAAADNADLYGFSFVLGAALRACFFFAFAILNPPLRVRRSSLPSRSRRYAAGFWGSCPKIAIQPSFTASGIHFFLFSSVVMGYKS